jgi:hypothetical protein
MEKIMRLLYHLGFKAETIMKTMTFTELYPETFDNAVKCFSAYFDPERNILFHRCISNKRHQLENESAEHFIREVLALADLCEFKDMKEEFTRDRLVVCIRDHKLSEELQEDHTITLAIVMETIRSRELIKQQQAVMVGEKGEMENYNNIDAVSQMKTVTTSYGMASKKEIQPTPIVECSFCGKQHASRACPAHGKTFTNCNKPNHFAIVCRSKQRNVKEVVATGEENNEMEDIYNGSIVEGGGEPWKAEVTIGSTKMTMKVDLGADVTCLSHASLE